MNQNLLVKLFGDNLVKNDGKETSISFKDFMQSQTQIIGLYFSAHWCGPCRQFTPLLKSVYKEWKQSKDNSIEIVFISSDGDEEDFKSYFNDHHGNWLSLKFGTQKALKKHFKVGGIPTLIFLDKNGNVLVEEGRSLVTNKGSAAKKELLKFSNNIAQPVDDGYYHIYCVHSNKVLDVSGSSNEENAKILQYQYHGGNNQKYLFQYQQNGLYSIQCKHSGLYWRIEDGGSKLIQSSDKQFFKFVAHGNNQFSIMVSHSNKFIDISGGSQNNCASVLQWAYHGGKNQWFTLKKA